MDTTNQVGPGPAAAIYLRVSTEDQARGLSLESQEAQCRAYCHREGLEVARVFIERGASAKTDERAEFQALIAYCRASAGRISHVVVYRLDRFSRVAHHVGIYRALLTAAGCRLASATENLSDDPAGKLLGTILAGIAEFDNDQKAVVVRANMRHLLEQGYWTHRPPFGYALQRNDSSPMLVPHPDTGPLLRECFQRMADRDWTPSAAMAFLSARGYRIGPSRFYRLLRSPVYAGLISTSLTGNPVQAKGKALIDMATFTRLQSVMRVPSRARHSVGAYPLRGVILCEHCKRGMTSSVSRGHGGKYAYYHCRHPGHTRLSADLVHGQLLDVLAEMSKTFAPLLKAVRSYCELVWREESASAEAMAKRAEKKASQLRVQQGRLLDAYLNGTITQAQFTPRHADLTARIDIADADAVAARVDRHEAQHVIDGATQILADFQGMWRRMDTDQRPIFARVLWPDGVVWSGDRMASSSLHLVRVRFGNLLLAPPSGGSANLSDALNVLRQLAEVAA